MRHAMGPMGEVPARQSLGHLKGEGDLQRSLVRETVCPRERARRSALRHIETGRDEPRHAAGHRRRKIRRRFKLVS